MEGIAPWRHRGHGCRWNHHRIINLLIRSIRVPPTNQPSPCHNILYTPVRNSCDWLDLFYSILLFQSDHSSSLHRPRSSGNMSYQGGDDIDVQPRSNLLMHLHAPGGRMSTCGSSHASFETGERVVSKLHGSWRTAEYDGKASKVVGDAACRNGLASFLFPFVRASDPP